MQILRDVEAGARHRRRIAAAKSGAIVDADARELADLRNDHGPANGPVQRQDGLERDAAAGLDQHRRHAFAEALVTQASTADVDARKARPWLRRWSTDVELLRGPGLDNRQCACSQRHQYRADSRHARILTPRD